MKSLYKIGLYIGMVVLVTFFPMGCDDDEVNTACQVTLVTNQNPGSEGDILQFTVQAGEFLAEPEMTRANYEFAGWDTDKASANNTKKDAEMKFPAYDLKTMPIYLDVTLYGRWVK
mgnify:CR=1 FL=1